MSEFLLSDVSDTRFGFRYGSLVKGLGRIAITVMGWTPPSGLAMGHTGDSSSLPPRAVCSVLQPDDQFVITYVITKLGIAK